MKPTLSNFHLTPRPDATANPDARISVTSQSVGIDFALQLTDVSPSRPVSSDPATVKPEAKLPVGAGLQPGESKLPVSSRAQNGRQVK
jgi:hypothetical protein